MDVQGLEFEVLQGAQNVLALGRTKIVAEMHPDQWPDYGVRPSEAAERFAAMGLGARPLIAGDPTFVQSGHVVLEFLKQ